CADKCGIVSNGCGEEVDGGLIDCSLLESSQCADGTECGAGGVPNQCGTAETACVPVEQAVACATVGCGVVSDGCAGSYSCQGCGAGEQCQQGSCQPLCVPVAQATACAGKTCGSVSDQCGGVYQCGTCPAGQQCGGSEPFQCSLIPAGPGSPDCVPLDPTVACNGRECGTVFDGCGSDPENEIDCSVEGNGGCSAGEYCGI